MAPDLRLPPHHPWKSGLTGIDMGAMVTKALEGMKTPPSIRTVIDPGLRGFTVWLWITVPDFDLFTPFYSFEPWKRAQLPTAPLLIAGNLERFAAIFHSA